MRKVKYSVLHYPLLLKKEPETIGGGDFVRSYEVMYIVKTMDEQATEEVISKFENLITKNGGTVEKTDRWGKRRLAYEIQDCRDGFYVLVNFTAEPAVILELDRVMKITDEVLRHMIVRKGE